MAGSVITESLSFKSQHNIQQVKHRTHSQETTLQALSSLSRLPIYRTSILSWLGAEDYPLLLIINTEYWYKKK